jgi:hypothetical protein
MAVWTICVEDMSKVWIIMVEQWMVVGAATGNPVATLARLRDDTGAQRSKPKHPQALKARGGRQTV